SFSLCVLLAKSRVGLLETGADRVLGSVLKAASARAGPESGDRAVFAGVGVVRMIDSQQKAGLGRLHDAMAARIAKGELPGMVTLVARDEDVHVDAIGMMAFDSDEPMRRDTIFRIASLTKPILAAATMMLVEDGTLALDEPIDRLLPELTDRRVLRRIDGPLDDTVPANRPITVEDLLTFRMGYGMVIEPTATPPFDPPFPIVQAANELQLVMGPPDPRRRSAF